MSDEQKLENSESRYGNYRVLDNEGEKIGKVDALFTDAAGQEAYLSVYMGFFNSRTILIPVEVTRINNEEQTVEISDSKGRVQDAPDFDGAEITDSYEDNVRRYFGLETYEGSFSDRVPPENQEYQSAGEPQDPDDE